MKRWILLPWLAICLGAFTLAQAAGLIIVPEPYPIPEPWPGPHPRPTPRPVPPPRPIPPASAPSFRPYPFAPLELTFHQVNARISDQIATTSIDQEFYNPNPQSIEGTFLFPVPKGAQLNKFTLEIAGKPVEAELLSADKARRIYEDIVRKMKDPALLEFAGRDLYKVRIFPIEGHSRKRIAISYSQVLQSDSGLVAYVYPLNLAKFSAKPIPSLSVKIELESKRPLRSIYSPSHTVEVRRHGENKAVIGYEASNVKPDADFQLFFARDQEDVGLNVMSYRSGSEDGYFLLLASPGVEVGKKQLVLKDVAFVLDTSGSMAGAKIEQARKALQFCIENLNDGDRFEILRFSSETEPLFNGLVDASKENRSRAAEFVKGLKAIGGTAIDDALRKAMELRPEKSERPYLVIFLTDGRPTVGTTHEDQIVAGVNKNSAGNTRVFCFGIGTDVNTHLLDKITESTRAFSQYVLPEEDIEVKVSNFFTKIKEPVLAGLKLSFGNGIRATKMYPSPLPDLFKGEQLVVVGRYNGAGQASLVLDGSVNQEKKRFQYEAAFPEKSTEHDFIPRLWATRRVGYLLDEIRLHGENHELRDEVTELARHYGIVTPYTAYLIMEDEAKRAVPLTVQSMPLLQEDREARRSTQSAYESFTRERTGDSAVAGARYGLAFKQANNASEAITTANAEVQRGFGFGGTTASSGPGAPVTSGGALAGGATTLRNSRLAGVPGSAAKPIGAGGGGALGRMNEYVQQARFVNGRSFYQNGNQWVDAAAQKSPEAKRVRIQFNSQDYFDLLAKNSEAAPWLALGQNVVFVFKNTVYEIYE